MEFLNNRAFHDNIARIQWMKTMDKLEDMGEEYPASSALSVNALVKLFENAKKIAQTEEGEGDE